MKKGKTMLKSIENIVEQRSRISDAWTQGENIRIIWKRQMGRAVNVAHYSSKLD